MSDTKYYAVSQRFRALDSIKIASITSAQSDGVNSALPGTSASAVMGAWISDALSDDGKIFIEMRHLLRTLLIFFSIRNRCGQGRG
jgi:hypothetical protein